MYAAGIRGGEEVSPALRMDQKKDTSGGRKEFAHTHRKGKFAVIIRGGEEISPAPRMDQKKDTSGGRQVVTRTH